MTLAEDSRSTVLSFWLLSAAAGLLKWFIPGVLTTGILIAALFLALFSLFFFRDPKRNIPAQKNALLSPADGKVLFVREGSKYPDESGTCTHMAVFLNLHDVHVNRIPYDGTVKEVTYQPGKFLKAFIPEAGDLNEQYFIRMETGSGAIFLRQVAGLVARRLVCRLHPDQEVSAGEKFGLMKFSSRIDLYFSSKFHVLVKPGERVRGGESILARYIGSEE